MPISPKLEELVDQRVLEDAFLVHLFHVRTNALVGKLADGIAKEHFIFGERDQRSGSRRGRFAQWLLTWGQSLIGGIADLRF